MRLRTKIFFITMLMWLAIIAILMVGLPISLPQLFYKDDGMHIYKYMVTFILIGVLILIVAELVLKYFIVDRISKFKSQLKNIIFKKDFTDKFSVDGNDEIAELASSSNELLKIMKENEDKLNNKIEMQANALMESERNEKKLMELNVKMLETSQNMESIVVQLKAREKQMTLINKTNELLQFCHDPAELYAIIDLAAKELFPKMQVELAIFNQTTKQLEFFGNKEDRILKDIFEPDCCWGLRAGHIYFSENSHSNLICEHFKKALPGQYICVPLVLGNETIGLMSFAASEHAVISPRQQQLAVTFSNTIKLPLYNLQ